MASITASLVLLIVKSKSKNKKNTILSWRPLGENDYDKEKYPNLFRLGGLKDNQQDGWAVYTHFYCGIKYEIINQAEKEVERSHPDIKSENIDSVVAIGFRINNGSKDDCDEDVLGVESRISEGKTVMLETLDRKLLLPYAAVSSDDVWYVMPYQESTSNDGNYVTAVGRQTIAFLTSDDQVAASCDLYTDTTPNVDRQKYDMMLDELAAIYEHAVYNEKSEQGVGVRRKPMSDHYYELLGQLEKLIRLTSLMPEVSLTDQEERLPASKIRRITARTLADSMGGGVSKFRTVTRRESFDIYEHRAIRSCLERIRDIALYSERMENEVCEDAEHALDANVVDENGIREKLDQTRDRVCELIDNINSRTDEATCYNSTAENEYRIWAEITSNILKEAMIDQRLQQGQWTIAVSSDGVYDWFHCKYGDYDPYPDVVEYQYETMFNNTIILNTSDELQKLFLCFYLLKYAISVDGNADIRIEGTGELRVSTKPENWDELNNNKKWYPTNKIQFNNIHSIKIGSEDITYDDFLSELRENHTNLKNEIILFSQELEMINHSYIEMRDYYQTLQRQAGVKTKNTWREIRSRAENILNTNYFLKCGRKRESLHPSNIFLKGRYYKDIYCLLQKRLGFAGFDIHSKDTTLIRAAQNVYERWALYKMLWYFTEKLGFGFRDNSDTLANALERYFSGRLSDRDEEPQFFRLSKTIDGRDLELDLVYQAHVEDNKGTGVKPDFVWIIRWKNKEKIFMLDTKYKDFGQQGKKEWLNLLFEVAYEKYLCRITYGRIYDADKPPIELGSNLCGSYILHSDTGTEDAFFQTDEGSADKYAYLSHYYGQNIEGLFNSNLDDKKKDQMERSWNNAPYDRFKEACRIGAVSMMPGHMDYFMNLFRMIMEHFFKLDSKVCWNCGGTEIEQLPSTKGVGTAYHCQTCHEFWVVTHCKNCSAPIRKHNMNYYFETTDNNWIIYCPKCGSNRVTE